MARQQGAGGVDPRILLCGIAVLQFIWGWNAVSHAMGGNFNLGFWGSIVLLVVGCGAVIQLIKQIKHRRRPSAPSLSGGSSSLKHFLS